MNDEQGQTLSLKAAYAFGAAHRLEREVMEICEMVIEWDSSYTSSLRGGYIVALFEKHNLFDAFKKEHWSFGNASAGEIRRWRYLRIKAHYEAFLAGRGSDPAVEGAAEGSSDPQQAVEFALEAHLRDLPAENLDRIETGMKSCAVPERNGVEFPVESMRGLVGGRRLELRTSCL